MMALLSFLDIGTGTTFLESANCSRVKAIMNANSDVTLYLGGWYGKPTIMTVARHNAQDNV